MEMRNYKYMISNRQLSTNRTRKTNYEMNIKGDDKAQKSYNNIY